MTAERIGILHPGEMGVSVAASAHNGGNTVYWASEGRSADSRARAEQHQLLDAKTIAQLCATCSIILSVCPPASAEGVAQAVIAADYQGLYLDANAISPKRAIHIGELLCAAGIDFVDGGIIGGPAWKPHATFLSLSGPHADAIAKCFAAGPLEVSVIGTEIGKASALKMCYSAYTKGTTALLAAILSAADQLGIRQELYGEWTRDDAAMPGKTETRVRNSTAKAWRFEGEMEEIAATFGAVGLPEGFHLAAADIYHRLAPMKAAKETPRLDDILSALVLGKETSDSEGQIEMPRVRAFN